MARIKGLKGGKTNITVSYGGKSATFSNFTVNKKTVTFSAPTLRSVSKYNGNGQALINSGSCTTGGTMYYYVSTSNSTQVVGQQLYQVKQMQVHIICGIMYM